MWINHIYQGTGVTPPAGDITPGTSAAIRSDIGARLNAIYARMRLNPSSRPNVEAIYDQARGPMTEQGRVTFQDVFNRYVRGPMESDLNSEAFAKFLRGLREEREKIAARAKGQPGDSDDWQIVRALNQAQRQITGEAEGSDADKAALRMWNGAYHRWAIYDGAQGPSTGGIATAGRLANNWRRHSGNYGADYATNPVKQNLERLRQAGERTPPRAPRRPRPTEPETVSRPRPQPVPDIGERPSGRAGPLPPRFPRLSRGAHFLGHWSHPASAAAAAFLTRHLGLPEIYGFPIWAALAQTPLDEMSWRAFMGAGRGARAGGAAASSVSGPASVAAGQAGASTQHPHITVTPMPPWERIPEAQ
jgi:hypothetical protein